MYIFREKQKKKFFEGYLLAGLIALELLMSFSFLGYIHIRPISITFAYIPVLLAGCLIGPKASVLTGFIFGLASMWKASAPYVATGDRIFSPFLSGKPLDSIFLSIGSRVLFGLIVGLLFLLTRKSCRPLIYTIIIALFGRALHSALVYAAMGLFFPEMGFHFANTFSGFGSPSNLLTSILTAVIVVLFYLAQNSAFLRSLKKELLAAHQPRMMNRKTFIPAVCIISVTLIAACLIAFYFVQRMKYMMDTSGYHLDETTQYNLTHLQIQFLLGLLALFSLVLLFLFFVYLYMSYMRYEAKTDSLTGITVERCVFSRCIQILPELHCPPNTSAYFMVLDIDNFKQVNDTFGHPKGDEIIRFCHTTSAGYISCKKLFWDALEG